MPSLYEGFSLPAIEAMSCGVPLVATTGGALPEVVGADGETAFLRAARRQRGARRQDRLRPRPTPSCGREVGAAGRQRVIDHWSWRHTAERTVEQYRALPGRAHGDRGAEPVLTVDYDRLDLEPGTSCCSTWAPAPAATPSRRSAAAPGSSRSTTTAAELKDVAGAVRRDDRGRRGAGGREPRAA